MFFKLTTDRWTNLYSQLTKSELGLLYYIRSLDPFGDREIDLNTSVIAEKLSISIRTVQRALSSLKKKELIVTKQIRSYIGGSKISPSDDIATRTDTLATPDDVKATQNVAKTTPMSFSRSQTTVKQEFQKPETNKTKQKKKDSLSQKLNTLPESEREKFLSFAREEVSKLPNPPVFPDKLVISEFDALYSRYKETVKSVVQDTNTQTQFVEWYELMKELGHVTSERKEGNKQLVKEIGDRWVEYEKLAKIWTLDYLKKCVKGR